MAYIKFKELTKYFDFSTEVDLEEIPEYVTEYVPRDEKKLLVHKNKRDHIIFTDKRMILFDRDALGIRYKKIHVIKYNSISSSAICYYPNRVDILLSMDSGYQMKIVFINMNHDKKERLKAVYKIMSS